MAAKWITGESCCQKQHLTFFSKGTGEIFLEHQSLQLYIFVCLSQVHPHYLAHEIKDRDDTTKESITVGLNFTVRQQHFIKSRMTLTCQANIEPDMYTGSTDVIIVEHVRPKLSSVVDKYSSPATEGASDRMSNSGKYTTLCTYIWGKKIIRM